MLSFLPLTGFSSFLLSTEMKPRLLEKRCFCPETLLNGFLVQLMYSLLLKTRYDVAAVDYFSIASFASRICLSYFVITGLNDVLNRETPFTNSMRGPGRCGGVLDDQYIFIFLFYFLSWVIKCTIPISYLPSLVLTNNYNIFNESLIKILYKDNKNHMSSNRYLQHLQNTSPAKTTYSFSKGSRFDRINSHTPNKFYDFPSGKSKRSTSLGFGKKSDMIIKALGDPGLYETKGQFQLMKSKIKNSIRSTFGESHENLFRRKLNTIRTPGPGEYCPESYKSKIHFYMGAKVKYPDNFIAKLKLGPQTYEIENCLDRLSKYKASKSFRIKTQSSTSKSKLQELTVPVPGPGAYNPQKILSLQQQAKSKTIKGPVSFTREKRLKTQIPKLVGPGSYTNFSVFGNNQDD